MKRNAHSVKNVNFCLKIKFNVNIRPSVREKIVCTNIVIMKRIRVMIKRKDVNDDGTEVTVETEREEFKCELCIFKTDKNDRFERHKKDIHSVQGKYFCTKCERLFDSRKDFNGHKYIDVVHGYG